MLAILAPPTAPTLARARYSEPFILNGLGRDVAITLGSGYVDHLYSYAKNASAYRRRWRCQSTAGKWRRADLRCGRLYPLTAQVLARQIRHAVWTLRGSISD